jgi:DNA-binding XRE family transcriptional regulator
MVRFMSPTTSRREAARITGVSDTTLEEWEKRGRIPPSATTAPFTYMAAVLRAKFFSDRMLPRDADVAIQMTRTQGGKTGENVDPFHAVVLAIQREEIKSEGKCTFHKAALLAGERDPQAYMEYVARNTRGTPEFKAQQASLPTPAPRTARAQSETMKEIFAMRKQHIADAAAMGRKMTIMAADQKTWEERPDLYAAYLKEFTR